MPEFEHKRSHRVAQLVQAELGQLLVEGVKDPRVGFVTVTEVRLSDDLHEATAFVSVFGTQEVRSQTLEGLKAAAGFLRRELGKRVKLRHTPELHFAHDTSLDQAQRLETLFSAAARGDHEVPDHVTPEALPTAETGRVATPIEMPPPPARKPQRPNARSGKRTPTRRIKSKTHR